MADRSAIEWTAATWNPTTGCDRISAGCDNCYALALAGRLKAMGQPKYQNDGDPRTSGPGFAVTVHPDALSIPRSWREPRLVFVDSMSDLSGRVTILVVSSPQVNRCSDALLCVRHMPRTGAHVGSAACGLLKRCQDVEKQRDAAPWLCGIRAGGFAQPLPGHVIATSIAGQRFTVSTGKSGRFTMLLPPGIYHLTGYRPRVHVDNHMMRCIAEHPVQVKAGKLTRGIEVFCSVPPAGASRLPGPVAHRSEISACPKPKELYIPILVNLVRLWLHL